MGFGLLHLSCMYFELVVRDFESLRFQVMLMLRWISKGWRRHG